MFSAHRILLVAAFATLASPVAAQQTSADQATSTMQQTQSDQTTAPTPQPAPEMPPPGPEQQSAPEPVPPPFPPMPRARPTHRWVDIGNHKVRAAHHRSKRPHRPTAAKHHRRPAISRRELHKCRHMNPKQLRRNHFCRTLLRHRVQGESAHRHHHRHGHQHHHRAKSRNSAASRHRLHHSRLRHRSVRRHSS